MTDAMASYFGGSVEISVTYEALNGAAVDTVTKVSAAEKICAEIRCLNERMRTIWQGETSEMYNQEVQELLAAAEERLAVFRIHAKNLQRICSRYIQTGKEIGGTVQTLSEEAIV